MNEIKSGRRYQFVYYGDGAGFSITGTVLGCATDMGDPIEHMVIVRGKVCTVNGTILDEADREIIINMFRISYAAELPEVPNETA
jgi:hypothetical protein